MPFAAEVRVRADEVDLVSGLLWGAGVSAVGEEPDGDVVVLRVDLPAGGAEALEAAIGRPVTVVTVDDGLDAWREHARVVRAGRVVVHPPWLPLGDVAADEVVVTVDPGPTFGHGAHPTTRLCLEAIDRLRPASVLDVGCGSGVLAVAAALLGAGRVAAVDVDLEAVRVTAETADRNGVIVAASTDWPDGTFDLVVANIGAATLRDLAPRLVAATAGTLVVSGLLDPPPPDLAAAFAPLTVVRDDRLEGWTALTVAVGV